MQLQLYKKLIINNMFKAQDFQHTLRRALDETRETVRKPIGEAKIQIPRYAGVVTIYQEQLMQSAGKMIEKLNNW